jgi:hypothetical protein
MKTVAQEAERTEQGACVKVFIIERPDDWTPTGPFDLPPNVELHIADDSVAASRLVDGFNSSEMVAPSGWWAIT